jgi:hypothetical protein
MNRKKEYTILFISNLLRFLLNSMNKKIILFKIEPLVVFLIMAVSLRRNSSISEMRIE